MLNTFHHTLQTSLKTSRKLVIDSRIASHGHTLWLALLLTLMMGLAGCSGSDDGPSDSSADPTHASEIPLTPAEKATNQLAVDNAKTVSTLRRLRDNYLEREVKIGDLELQYLTDECKADLLQNDYQAKVLKGLALAINYYYLLRLNHEYGQVNQESFDAWTSELFSTLSLFGTLTPEQSVIIAKVVAGDMPIPTAHREYLGALAATLLRYEQTFSQFYADPAIKEALDTAEKIDLQLLQEQGFPLHDNPCFLEQVGLAAIQWDSVERYAKPPEEQEEYDEYDDYASTQAADESFTVTLTPEAYLYSFWLRRAQEQKLQHTQQLLTYAVEKLDCCDIPNRPTMKTSDTQSAILLDEVNQSAPIVTRAIRKLIYTPQSSNIKLKTLDDIYIPDDCIDPAGQQRLLDFTNGIGISFYYYYEVAMPVLFQRLPQRDSEYFPYVTRPNLWLTANLDTETVPTTAPQSATELNAIRYLTPNQASRLARLALNIVDFADEKRPVAVMVNELLNYHDKYADIFTNPEKLAAYQAMPVYKLDSELGLDDVCFAAAIYPPLVPNDDEWHYRNYTLSQANNYIVSFWLRRYAEGTDQQTLAVLKTAQEWLKQ